MRPLTLILFTLLTLQSTAGAQPATQPSGDAAPHYGIERPGRMGPAERFRDRQMMFPGGGIRRPLSDDDIDAVTEFMRANMPNFYQFVEQTHDGQPHALLSRNDRLTDTFRLLLNAQRNDDQAMVEIITRQLRLRDEFFGLVRNNREAPDDQRGRLQRALREKTQELVDAWLDQRELRIQRLEQMLQQERQRLSEDRADPAALMRRQFRMNIDEARSFIADPPPSAASQPED